MLRSVTAVSEDRLAEMFVCAKITYPSFRLS